MKHGHFVPSRTARLSVCRSVEVLPDMHIALEILFDFQSLKVVKLQARPATSIVRYQGMRLMS